jgi:hypothetical protein
MGADVGWNVVDRFDFQLIRDEEPNEILVSHRYLYTIKYVSKSPDLQVGQALELGMTIDKVAEVIGIPVIVVPSGKGCTAREVEG